MSSKDNNTVVKVSVGEKISWSVTKYGVEVFPNVNIDMSINGKVLGENAKVLSDKVIEHSSVIIPILPLKNSEITDSYKELQLKFKGNFGVHFRAYNEALSDIKYPLKKD